MRHLSSLALFSSASGFSGTFFDGTDVSSGGDGDAQMSYLELLDVARRQYSSTEFEYQSINQLYRGDWDGLMEGPTWEAYWTQNSFGPTMSSLPFMEDVTWAAVAHSQAWWFNSIGDGKSVGFTGEAPAPDGCLCDAAVPCLPSGARDNTCSWYKQGDGVVPSHDWTVEETLSAVVMQAEMLLVGRNATGARSFLPLFLRTSDWLESRRDPATGNATFLTGPSTNLLAPSWGGGPNGTMAYLAGVSITYTAALNRMLELARMLGDDAVAATLEARRDLASQGLGSFLVANSSGAETNHYFVRSVDPSTSGGALHGVIGQERFGYFEASPNHDAVAWRVVNDSIAEQIMSVIDALGDELRPNTFILPNTDAGGGVGYDDMLCGDGSAYCDGKTRGGIFGYGTWVNGGVWITQEARAILAYYRTGRTDAAAASMRAVINRLSRNWVMDAPLTNFGLDTWAHEPTMLTVDTFGCGAALVRGLFEYLYDAKSLTLLPHLPDSLTQVVQKFGVRWGPYRLFISSEGVRSSGIGAVTLNGTALGQPHTFNSTTLVLDFGAMPPASAAAIAAIDSDVSIAATAVFIHIIFKDAAASSPRSTMSAAPAETEAVAIPPTQLNCSTLRRACNAPAGRRLLGAGSRSRLSTGAWPRQCGLSSTELARLHAFIAALEQAGAAQVASLPYAMAREALDFTSSFQLRCDALNAGAVQVLPSDEANSQSLTSLLTAGGNLYDGMDNALTKRYATSAEPLARSIASTWASTIGTSEVLQFI